MRFLGKHFNRFLCAVFVAALTIAAACVAGEESHGTLYVYTWANYFSPRAVELFEQRHDCKVEFYYYDSNDTMQENLRESGGYDVITPSSTVAADLFSAGALLTLDHSLIPNLRHFDTETPALVQDAEMRYGIPYTLTVTGLGYNPERVSAEAVRSWDIFGDAARANRMTMMNDMRETLGAGLKHLGHSLNTVDEAEILEATRLVGKWKDNLAVFDVDQAREGLREDRYDVIQAYNGDMALLISETPNLAFYIPEEGAPLNTDKFVIAADAPNPDLAHAFINHFLDPEIAAMNMEDVYFFMPVPEAIGKLSKRLRDNPAFDLSRFSLEKCEMILNVGANRRLYDEAWETVLIGDE